MRGAIFDGELITKAGAAKLLGVSTKRVTQFRGEGKLSTTRDAKGTHLYQRTEVIRLALERGRSRDPRVHKKETSSVLAAKVFELFDRGATLSEIVQETVQTPDVIRALYIEYRTPLGSVPKPPDDPAAELTRHAQIMDAFARSQARRFDRENADDRAE